METDDSHRSIAERLRMPVHELAGVPARLVPLLHRLGLRTAGDLLFFFPRSYEDLTRVCRISEIDGSGPVSVCGVVDEVELRALGPGRTLLGALIRDESGALRAVWFNQSFMQQRLVRGQRVMLSGVPKRRGLGWELAHPRLVPVADDAQPTAGPMLPVYPLTEGLVQGRLRKIVHRVVAALADEVVEVFPAPFLTLHQLWPIGRALRAVHMPQDSADVRESRRRFVYQELLVLQLALALRRWQLQRTERAPALPATAKIDARIRRLFPFELTADQEQAIRDIATDMGRCIPMNRLLQGEVGSGKTVVAEYAMLLAVAHAHQAVLMAPTEVLAQQHFRTLGEDLAQSRVRIELLTGALTGTLRQQLLGRVQAGEVDLLIGTQALLHEPITFPQLGLVVIDEQHKFGVRQRAALKSAGSDPHYLVMTATPIPRTVAMSLFGDLDVSTLRQSPPGRQPVHTYLVADAQRDRWWSFVRRKLQEGRQGYVIAPRVEEDESASVASVEEVYERLVNGPLEAFRVDLIHGRLSPAEKEAAMAAFRRGATQVLVATSVIEVGIDVPNATLLTIESGERFGLAQLHQLRGRVRRGQFPGYVTVFAQPGSPAAQERLAAFERSTDGFELAEIDFALRGPGDLFGVSQHGMPPLRVADLQRDQQLLVEARQDAQALTAGDAPPFFQEEFAALRSQVLRRYSAALDLGDVG
ncbi:MAG: ATP-dependent DNA helicase RecG [Planctomycetaceae bacterium]|nr:ATP-dependent DNA helicase RecG [Planctomycetaceae bacterium]